jgi:hypothetical protein
MAEMYEGVIKSRPWPFAMNMGLATFSPYNDPDDPRRGLNCCIRGRTWKRRVCQTGRDSGRTACAIISIVIADS